MTGVRKSVLALLVSALLAVGLAACGDPGDSGTTAADNGPEITEVQRDQAEQGGGDGAQGTEPGDDSSSGDSGGGGSGDDSAGDDSAEEGSASFRVKGGDNSIQNYGEEAPADERSAAEDALSAYMAARAKRDWNAACPYLAKAAVQPLEQAVSKSGSGAEGCAAALEAVTGQASAAAFANTLRGPVASLRVEGDRAFALYHGPGDVDYFVPMVKEDGQWKVGTISPSEFF